MITEQTTAPRTVAVEFDEELSALIRACAAHDGQLPEAMVREAVKCSLRAWIESLEGDLNRAG